MKSLIRCVVLLIFVSPALEAQTFVSGTLLSRDVRTIQDAHIRVSPWLESGLFGGEKIIRVDADGTFSFNISNPGLYQFTFSAPMHSWVTATVLIAGQNELQFNAYLLPKRYDNGRYFKNEEYMEWIRVYGNFNNYDFNSGTRFEYNEDGSVTARIQSKADTLTWQVRGLTSGADVLPGADFYRMRHDGTYEAVIVNPDSVEVIRYKPRETVPYHRSSRDLTVGYGLFLQMEMASDSLWFAVADLSSNFYTRFRYIESLDEISTDSAIVELWQNSDVGMGEFSSGNYYSRLLDSIIYQLKSIENLIEKGGFPAEKEIALHLCYIHMVIQIYEMTERYNSYPLEFRSNQGEDIQFPTEIIDQKIIFKTFEIAPPTHPMWAVQPEAPAMILQNYDYDDEVLRYFEQMVRYNTNDQLAASLFLHLIDSETGRSSSIEETSYYYWILERYGNGNLARKAREVFYKNR